VPKLIFSHLSFIESIFALSIQITSHAHYQQFYFFQHDSFWNFYWIYLFISDLRYPKSNGNSLEFLDCFFFSYCYPYGFQDFFKKKPRKELRGFGLVLCLELTEVGFIPHLISCLLDLSIFCLPRFC
jgi:hypothetical protein